MPSVPSVNLAAVAKATITFHVGFRRYSKGKSEQLAHQVGGFPSQCGTLHFTDGQK